ncbi:AtpZ/AtpI family protein [Desulfosarcina sp. OttesenSCG-928-G10]|nr:AtpZ/AtpI family protein [Desulfosarcina sp. OttesenSCG-928-G10]
MNKETRLWLRELAFYSSLGLSVALSIFIGVGIGIYLDRHFDTQPWLMLVFLGLGIAAAYRNIALAVRKSRNL